MIDIPLTSYQYSSPSVVSSSHTSRSLPSGVSNVTKLHYLSVRLISIGYWRKSPHTCLLKSIGAHVLQLTLAVYYINPFNYLVGGLVTPIMWDVSVKCTQAEYGILDPPAGLSCGDYLSSFIEQGSGYVSNPDATGGCEYCPYTVGYEYLRSYNLTQRVYTWRNICLTLLFVLSSYGLVFILL